MFNNNGELCRIVCLLLIIAAVAAAIGFANDNDTAVFGQRGSGDCRNIRFADFTEGL